MKELIYETKELHLGITDVKSYVAPINPRDIQPRHVEHIRNSFNAVKSVEGVVAVNLVPDSRKLEVIDGNHRMTAITQWLEEHPEDHITATFHIYKNLTNAQKKAVFAKLQASVKMTKTDLVKTQCYDSFIYQAFFDPMKKLPFPCNVTMNESDRRNSIKFFRLFEPYNARHFRNCAVISLRNAASIVNKLDKEDHDRLARYMEDFIATFGEPHGELNRLYSGMAFHMGYQKIYWQGVNAMGREKFAATMKKNFAMIRGTVESELARRSGLRYQAEQVYLIVRSAVNKWEKRNLTNLLDITDEVNP